MLELLQMVAFYVTIVQYFLLYNVFILYNNFLYYAIHKGVFLIHTV